MMLIVHDDVGDEHSGPVGGENFLTETAVSVGASTRHILCFLPSQADWAPAMTSDGLEGSAIAMSCPR